MNRKLATPLDFILIVLIVVCALIMILNFTSNTGKFAVVSVNDKTIAQLDLSNNQTKHIETEQGYNVIVIKNGKCTVSDADCRDGICVNHSAINKIGQSIVCLPHKLIVEIK